jgi:putative sterol carrier protein
MFAWRWPVPELADDAWLKAYVEAQADRPAVVGADATVQVVLEGGPAGKVVFREKLADGRAIAVEPGAKKGCDLELTMKWDIATEVLTGEVDPNVPFMQGRLKVAGDYALWLRLARPLADHTYRDRLKSIGAD